MGIYLPAKTRLLNNLTLALLIVLNGFLVASCSQPYGPDWGRGCKKCHAVIIDKDHNFECTKCHRGNDRAISRLEAHLNLIRHPASKENAIKFCGGCHKSHVESATTSIHYTLKNEIATIWHSFFQRDKPPDLSQIRAVPDPGTKKDLIIDLLARRCLKCHAGSSGEGYSGTYRGIGCAACHLRFSSKGSHVFHRPHLKNCLSCHYGNFVGWDFVGRFESDYPEDFRSPLENGRHIKRAYGLEWIEMSPDIHFKKGMTCLSCHLKQEFHPNNPDDETGPRCTNCHNNLSLRFGHTTSSLGVSCGVCHAKWGFYDYGRSLIRLDGPDMEDWSYLRFQGSLEIERLKNEMKDKTTGQITKGVWIEGFTKRRWWPVILGMSPRGEVKVIRPLMDLNLYYVDEDEEVVFDAISPAEPSDWRQIYPKGYLENEVYWAPYTPHTIGHADTFRAFFIQNMLKSERNGGLKRTKGKK